MCRNSDVAQRMASFGNFLSSTIAFFSKIFRAVVVVVDYQNTCCKVLEAIVGWSRTKARSKKEGKQKTPVEVKQPSRPLRSSP